MGTRRMKTTNGLIVLVAALAMAVSSASAADSVYWGNYEGNSISFAPLAGGFGADLGTTGTTADGPEGVAIDASRGKIYWTNTADNRISFANLDGSGGGDLAIGGSASLDVPSGLAIDPIGGKLYWANLGNDAISVANLDGSGGADLDTGIAPVEEPSGITIDPAGGRIYWANFAGGTLDAGSIAFASLGGGGGGVVFTGPLTGPAGVALDPASGRIYWPSYIENEVAFANIDGSGGFGSLDTTGAEIAGPEGVALDPEAQRAYWGNFGANTISYANWQGNGGGGDLGTSTPTTEAPVFPVLLKKPAGAGAPTVSGGTAPGTTLACSQGSWGADILPAFFYRAPQGFSYQWIRDGAEIAGANSSSIAASPPGNYSCRVTATNHAGSTSQTSAPHAVPSNSFTIGKPKLNKKKGTAKLPVTVPGPGTVALAGKRIVAVTKSAKAGGTLKLAVKAKGKAKRKLAKKGKAKVKLTVTFTPAGGTAATQKKTLKLIKRRARR